MKPTPIMPTSLTTTQRTTESLSERDERIRCRAYELYEQRGKEDGHDVDDWLRAESEMTQSNVNAVAA